MPDWIQRLRDAESAGFWRRIQPDSAVSDDPFQGIRSFDEADHSAVGRYESQLKEEGYFQSEPLVPVTRLEEMVNCVNCVQRAGFPPIFALVYDVFFSVFAHLHSTLEGVLGPGCKLVPDLWIHYVKNDDASAGAPAHRDDEHENTVRPDGTPRLLTVWVALTEAHPLNSCMYVLPASRDPEYVRALRNLDQSGARFPLEDIRAIPARAGTMSCWNQHVLHWGSRSSRRADSPRISYAAYYQRGDSPPITGVAFEMPFAVDFEMRLGAVCRGLDIYSGRIAAENQSGPLREFIEHHLEALRAN